MLPMTIFPLFYPEKVENSQIKRSYVKPQEAIANAAQFEIVYR